MVFFLVIVFVQYLKYNSVTLNLSKPVECGELSMPPVELIISCDLSGATLAAGAVKHSVCTLS